MSSFDERARARAGWPIVRYALGDEPLFDPRGDAGVDERIALVWQLTQETWAITGRPLPTYPRERMPGALLRAPAMTLPANQDFVDVLRCLARERCERVHRALALFGAPLAAHGVRADDLATPGTVYQMGLPPRRIDVMTSISGVTFDEAAAEAIEGQVGDERVRFIGRTALVTNKRAAGRTKDLADAEALEAASE